MSPCRNPPAATRCTPGDRTPATGRKRPRAVRRRIRPDRGHRWRGRAVEVLKIIFLAADGQRPAGGHRDGRLAR
ncbi:MAG: hypothetical protein MZW92_32540 [Comamonadaceae bacterium]|nr:hypothetical protein [Comamonadaceae bacterium]